MASTPDDPAARAREQQRVWYGEPLGDLFRGLMTALGLNQARLAAVLGLSAPMLSQLISGQRAKIGNPAVVQRLQALRELAAQVADGTVTAAEATGRMDEIRGAAAGALFGTSGTQSRSGTQSTDASRRAAAPSARRMVRELQSLLRALASADEILAAADTLATGHPGLAEFLRVYGAGRTDDAVAHFEAHQD